MDPKQRIRLEKQAEKEARIYKTTGPISLSSAFSGFGGKRAKHRPITMIHGKVQRQWRKKLRRMGKKRADKFLKACGYRR